MNKFAQYASIIGYAFVFGATFATSGCGSQDSVVTASSRVKSPDGNWIALTKTRQNAGPGTGDIETNVYLKWSASSYPPEKILGFTNDTTTTPSVSGVKMQWITNNHLDVEFEPGNNLGFQAIKAGGVEITVHKAE